MAAAPNPINRSMIVSVIAVVALALVAGFSAFSYVQSNNTISMQSSKIANLNSQMASEITQMNSLNSQVSSQSTQIGNLNSQVTDLNGQVSNLESINGLSDSQLQLSAQSFTTGSGGNVSVVSFTVGYAGYVVASMSSASDYPNEGVVLDNRFSLSVNSPYYSGIIMPYGGGFYSFTGVPDAIVFPVVPGTATVYLSTSDTSAQSATITVTYYY